MRAALSPWDVLSIDPQSGGGAAAATVRASILWVWPVLMADRAVNADALTRARLFDRELLLAHRPIAGARGLDARRP